MYISQGDETWEWFHGIPGRYLKKPVWFTTSTRLQQWPRRLYGLPRDRGSYTQEGGGQRQLLHWMMTSSYFKVPLVSCTHPFLDTWNRHLPPPDLVQGKLLLDYHDYSVLEMREHMASSTYICLSVACTQIYMHVWLDTYPWENIWQLRA